MGDWRLARVIEGAIFAVAAVACRRTKVAAICAYNLLSALPWDVRRRVPTDAREFSVTIVFRD